MIYSRNVRLSLFHIIHSNSIEVGSGLGMMLMFLMLPSALQEDHISSDMMTSLMEQSDISPQTIQWPEIVPLK